MTFLDQGEYQITHVLEALSSEGLYVDPAGLDRLDIINFTVWLDECVVGEASIEQTLYTIGFEEICMVWIVDEVDEASSHEFTSTEIDSGFFFTLASHSFGHRLA